MPLTLLIKLIYEIKEDSVRLEITVFRQLDWTGAGRIYLHSMPGRKEAWDHFLAEKQAMAISHVLCLTSDCEISEKSPDYASAIERDAIVDHLIKLGVEDFSIPEDLPRYINQIRALACEVESGAHLLIHCAAGIGRTGCAAIAILYELGVSYAVASDAVLAAGSTPETDEQWAFIQDYCAVNE